jgi:hypothetical protein
MASFAIAGNDDGRDGTRRARRAAAHPSLRVPALAACD